MTYEKTCLRYLCKNALIHVLHGHNGNGKTWPMHQECVHVQYCIVLDQKDQRSPTPLPALKIRGRAFVHSRVLDKTIESGQTVSPASHHLMVGDVSISTTPTLT